ncbi:MAG: hypothetical protein AB7F59_09320 [Bdellovibrionales bacterium]
MSYKHNWNFKVAAEEKTSGLTTGAAIGGVLGWLAGVGALAIPGLAPFISAGPIVSALAGAGVGGVIGSLFGQMISFGFPEQKKHRSIIRSRTLPQAQLTTFYYN